MTRLLPRWVGLGCLGQKSEAGFYGYNEQSDEPIQNEEG